MNKREEEELLTRYYLQQSGYGSEIYHGQLYQKGMFIVAYDHTTMFIYVIYEL